VGASEKHDAAWHGTERPPAPEFAPTARCVTAIGYPDETIQCERGATGWAWFCAEQRWLPTCLRHSEVSR
jgi:hypothetical protein